MSLPRLALSLLPPQDWEHLDLLARLSPRHSCEEAAQGSLWEVAGRRKAGRGEGWREEVFGWRQRERKAAAHI